MKKNLNLVKNTVVRHRGTIAFVAGFAVCFAMTNTARNQWNEFLDEKGLTDEFYSPED